MYCVLEEKTHRYFVYEDDGTRIGQVPSVGKVMIHAGMKNEMSPFVKQFYLDEKQCEQYNQGNK